MLSAALASGTEVLAVSSPPAGEPAPSWWGGSSESLDAAIAAAGEWAKTCDLSPSIEGRTWTTADGRWAVGASVVRPSKSTSTELDAEIRQSEQHSLKLVARERAIRAAAVLLSADRDPVAVQGRGASKGFDRGVFEVKARLDPAPRTRLYEAPGRLYAIALLDVASVRTLSLDGVEVRPREDLSAFRPWGLIELATETQEAAVFEALLREASEGAPESSLLLAASQLAIDRGRRDLATGWVQESLRHPIDLSNAALSVQARLTKDLGIKAPLLARLAETSDFGTRLCVIAESTDAGATVESRTHQYVLLDGEPIPVSLWRQTDPADEEQAEATAFAAATALESELARGWKARRTFDANGSPLLVPLETESRWADPRVAISRTPKAAAARLDLQVDPGPGDSEWLEIVVPSAASDGAWSLRRRGIVESAIVAWCLEHCRLTELSSGEVAAALAEIDHAKIARWVVAEEASSPQAYRVVLDEAAIESRLRSANRMASISLGLAAMPDTAAVGLLPQAERESLLRTLVSHFEALGWSVDRSGESDAVDLGFEISLDRGEEPGSLGKPKPFVEPTVVARLLDAGTPIPGAEAKVTGRKVYGSHSPAGAVLEAAKSALTALLEMGPSAVRTQLDERLRPIGQAGMAAAGRFDPAWWSSLAGHCGIAAPLDEAARWPGGPTGFARFCGVAAMVAPRAEGPASEPPSQRGRP
jgi:hypothetical protein